MVHKTEGITFQGIGQEQGKLIMRNIQFGHNATDIEIVQQNNFNVFQ